MIAIHTVLLRPFQWFEKCKKLLHDFEGLSKPWMCQQTKQTYNILIYRFYVWMKSYPHPCVQQVMDVMHVEYE